MAKHKFTFEFEATVGTNATSGSNFGWTESWYNQLNATLLQAIDDAKDLAKVRRALLTPGWSLTGCRITNLDANNNVTRRGTFVAFPPADAKGTYAGLGGDEQAYDCLNISLSTIEGNHRTWQMRGIGNDVVNAGSRFLNPPAFNAAFDAFKVELVSPAKTDWGADAGNFQNFCLKVRTKQGDQKILDVIINPVTYRGANPDNPVLVIDGNLNVFAGQTIIISGVKGMTHLNGSWIIKTLEAVGGQPPDHVILFPKRRATVGGTYQPGGRVVTYSYTLSELNNATAERGATRRTGRPSQQARGRRSNRTS